jgi:hypothetical protein
MEDQKNTLINYLDTKNIIMKKIILLLSFQLMLFAVANSQEIKIEGVKSFEPRGVGNIIEDEKMVGYYYFYKVDAIDDTYESYKLVIKDANLATVKEIDIVRKSGEKLREVVYNGSHFACLFYNYSPLTATGRLNIVSYDKTGQQSGSFEIDPIHAFDLYKYNYTTSLSEMTYFKTIFPRGKDGFLVQVSNNDGYKGYSIYGVDNKLEQVWKYSTPIGVKGVNSAIIMDFNDKYVVLQTTHQSNILSGKVEQGISVINVNTGVDVAVFESNFLGKSTTIMDAVLDRKKEEIVVVGDYLEKGEKVFIAPLDGIYFARYTVQGKELQIKKVSYKGAIIPAMDADYHKMLSDKSAQVFIRKAFTTDDGRVVLMTELVEKAKKLYTVWSMNEKPKFNGKVIALHSHKIVSFELAANNDSVSIKSYDKAIGTYWINEMFEKRGVYTLAYLEAMAGGLDYRFTSFDRKNDVVLNYFNCRTGINIKGDKFSHHYSIVKFEKGEFSTIDFEHKDEDFETFRILPAKYGFVTLINYNLKEKAVYWKLEKAIY